MNEKIEKLVNGWMEDDSFEELLEVFDITPVEAFIILFEHGMVDEELLERYTKI